MPTSTSKHHERIKDGLRSLLQLTLLTAEVCPPIGIALMTWVGTWTHDLVRFGIVPKEELREMLNELRAELNGDEPELLNGNGEKLLTGADLRKM